MRLLMVENHAVFAEQVVRQFLGDHDVVIAPSLKSARAFLSTRSFDVLLVDFDLDDGKGATLVEELRTAGYGGRIIAISSHDAGNGALRSAGADAVCPKLQFARIAEYLR